VKAKFDAEAGVGGKMVKEVTQDLLKMRLWMPARAIQIAALRYGRPSGGASDKIRYVNNAMWPSGTVQLLPGKLGGPPISATAATAYDVGFWMMSEFSSEYYQNTGQTLVRASATTQVVEDWSVILFVENRETGKRPFGGLTPEQQEAYMNTLTGPSYSYGEIESVNGAVRIGPYPLINFQSLFGF
jgi:hypothetical protein